MKWVLIGFASVFLVQAVFHIGLFERKLSSALLPPGSHDVQMSQDVGGDRRAIEFSIDGHRYVMWRADGQLLVAEIDMWVPPAK